MHIDHFDSPGLVRHIHAHFGDRWFSCSEMENADFKKYLLKICDPRNGAGKDYFRMKYDETTNVRLYQLKQSAITKFIDNEEKTPSPFSTRLGDNNPFFPTR
jgi:hypothetical protein